jgi:hypothetical protein
MSKKAKIVVVPSMSLTSVKQYRQFYDEQQATGQALFGQFVKSGKRGI